MNRRGFLGAMLAAAAAPAVAQVPSLEPEAPPPAPALLPRRREPAELMWKLPREWTLDHVQHLLEQATSTWPRLIVTAAEFGSFEDRRRFVRLVEERATPEMLAAMVPIYVSERLGERTFRIEMERRS